MDPALLWARGGSGEARPDPWPEGTAPVTQPLIPVGLEAGVCVREALFANVLP